MLRLVDVSKKYGSSHILNKINYNFVEGKVYFVVGDSGSGKTTLLNLIGGLDEEYEGDIYFDDVNIKKYLNKEKSIYYGNCVSFINQKPVIFDFLNGMDNINVVRKIKKKRKNSLFRFLDDIKLKRKAKLYSNGEKQRIAIQRCIDKNAKIVLADEPTASLDKTYKNEVIEQLIAQCKDKILIIVTHDIELSSKYGDEVLKIENKRIKNNSKDKTYNHLEVIRNNNKKLSFLDSFLFAFKKYKGDKTSSFIYITSVVMSIVLLIITSILTSSLLSYFQDELLSSSDENRTIEIDYSSDYLDLEDYDKKYLIEKLVHTNLMVDYNLENINTSCLIDDASIDIPFLNFINYYKYEEEMLSENEIVLVINSFLKEELEQSMCVDLYEMDLLEFVDFFDIKLYIDIYNDLKYVSKEFYINKIIINDFVDEVVIMHNNLDIISMIKNDIYIPINDIYYNSLDENSIDFFNCQDEYCLYLYNNVIKIKKRTEKNIDLTNLSNDIIHYKSNVYYNCLNNNIYENITYKSNEISFEKYNHESIIMGSHFNYVSNKEILISKGLYDLIYEEKFIKKREIFQMNHEDISFDIIGVVQNEKLEIYYSTLTLDYINELFNPLYNYKDFIVKEVYVLHKNISYDDLVLVMESLKLMDVSCVLFDVLESMNGTIQGIELAMNIFSIVTLLISLVALVLLNILDYEKNNKQYSMLFNLGYTKKDISKLFLAKNLLNSILIYFISIFSLEITKMMLNVIFKKVLLISDFIVIKDYNQILILSIIVFVFSSLFSVVALFRKFVRKC